MLKSTLVAAALAVSQSNAFIRMEDVYNNDAVSPTPGGTQIFLSVPSMNTLFQDFFALASPYVIVGKEIDINKEITLGSLDLKINSVNITSFNVGNSGMEFVKGTDTVRTTISNTDIHLSVDAEATSKIPIPLEITDVYISGASLQLDLATTTDNQVNWQLVESSILSFKDINVTCAEKVWQKAFDTLKPEIIATSNYLLKFAEGVVSGAVDAFNYELAHQTDDTFVFDIAGIPLNLTMTKYPELNSTE